MQTRTEAKKRKKLDTMRNQSNVEDVDSEPDPPTKFFFSHNCYKTSPNLSSRYSQENVPNELKKVLTEEELDWFIYHPQFKHIWHMYREPKHKFNPMWLLLLRTVFIDKEKVCWFVVNGVPIRYSIREHGLLCGLNCSSYPPNHLHLGSEEFFKRNFGEVEKNTVKIKDVKEKLSSDCFEVTEDRLKMAVLLFLSIIIKPKKTAGTIDRYLFRIVDDLSECERFPWGRYTFIDTINNISHLIQWFKGHAGKDWAIPGFIYPLEIMACECIPELKGCYREAVADADPNCPRMCKSKWKRNKKTLKAVNETLGDTKEIHSILYPRVEEKCLVDEIFKGEEEQLYSTNPVAQSWEKRLIENKKIFWKELYHQDISSRSPNAPQLQQQERQRRPRPLKLRDDQDQLMRAMETSVRKLETKIITRLINLETEVRTVRTKVSNLETEVRTVRTKVSNLETEFRTTRERNASEFNGFSENGYEHAAQSFGGGGDENTNEGEDEVWEYMSVTELITSDDADAAEGQSRNDSGTCGIGLEGTVREQQSDTNGISCTEEVMPAASDQVVITPYDNPNSRSVGEEQLDTYGIRHTGEELQDKHTELSQVELLQNNHVESSKVQNLKENLNRYEEPPVEVDERLQPQHEHAGDSFCGGRDENTKEGEDELWADTSVIEVLASDEVWADTSVTEVLASDLSPHGAASETLAPTPDAAERQSRNNSGTVREQQLDTNTEEVMPDASDQVVITPYHNPNSRSVEEEQLDTYEIRHIGEELQDEHIELIQVELLQDNHVESIEVENLKENLNRYEERQVNLQAQHEKAEQELNRLQASLEPLDASFQECISTKESMMKRIEEKHHDNAASVFCCLYRKAPPPQSLFLSKKKGFFGVVALLGSVACMSLSRVLSDYLGKDKMLSLVCKSSQSGLIRDEYRKLQSEAASLGRSITNPLKVIRLDAAGPWRYGFVSNDPQKRLAMDKPYLPNGDPIPGFKGYAVNMIDLASENLHIQSSSGHGLRETLFYDIFRELQVYETAEHLEAALPYINGKDAVSLDGVIATGSGFTYPGSCAPDVHFPITEKAMVKLEITEDRKRKTEKMMTEENCSSHKLVKKFKKATE